MDKKNAQELRNKTIAAIAQVLINVPEDIRAAVTRVQTAVPVDRTKDIAEDKSQALASLSKAGISGDRVTIEIKIQEPNPWPPIWNALDRWIERLPEGEVKQLDEICRAVDEAYSNYCCHLLIAREMNLKSRDIVAHCLTGYYVGVMS